MSQQNPEIGLFVQEPTPNKWIEEFREEIDDQSLTFDFATHSGGPYAGMALYLPTAIGIFIASHYFGGAFKKLGEEHYMLVKSAAIKLWKRARRVRITAIGPSAKVSDFDRYQLAYSITGAVSDGLRFKLVLKMDISDKESEQAISNFLDLIRDIHLGSVSKEYLEALLAKRPIGGTAVLTYDQTQNKLMPAD